MAKYLDSQAIRAFLFGLVEKRCEPDALDWLKVRGAAISAEEKPRLLYMAFSAVPRYTGKGMLNPTEAERRRANELRPDWKIAHWTLDEAARLWLMLQVADNKAVFLDRLNAIFETADMREQVALYKGLPIMPYPDALVWRASEGVRTNMTVVFDAIVLDNPFPADHMEEGAWNQAVLKAAFMDRPFYRIQGLKQRANAALARIISDYAHERWAASRVVSPEFWQPVSGFLDDVLLSDMERLFQDENPLQQQAATLVCHEAGDAGSALLEKNSQWTTAVKSGELNWESLGKSWWERKEMLHA